MQRSKGRLEIPPWLAIVVISVIVILMAASSTPSLTSRSPQPSNVVGSPLKESAANQYMADPAMTMKHVRLIARQSHGDWDLLSASDRQLLDSMTGGHGRAMLEMTAREQNAKQRSRDGHKSSADR